MVKPASIALHASFLRGDFAKRGKTTPKSALSILHIYMKKFLETLVVGFVLIEFFARHI